MSTKNAKTETVKRWAYTLRILGRNPEKIPMARLGEYMTEFAELLGAENRPTFAGIKRASTGLRAHVPDERIHYVHVRLVHAKNDHTSKPGRHLERIQTMIDADGIRSAELLDKTDNVVYLFTGQPVEAKQAITLHQSGTVDGIVTGLVGADATMHLHLRDYLDRDIRILVRSENLARALLEHFRSSPIRVHVDGLWKRTDEGWVPENNRCTAGSFDVLDTSPIQEILAKFKAAPGNGWKDIADPIGFLDEIRGGRE